MWIEYAHLSAIRQDTYSYPFREFRTDWTCAIMEEYPNFFIVGEEWIDDASVISYETVMVILNKNTKPYNLELARFQEHIENNSSATDIITNQRIALKDSIFLQPMRPYIFEHGQ